MDDNEKIIVERYRLTLKHEIIDGDGTTHELDKPLIVDMVVPIGDMFIAGTPIMINEMLDRMKNYVLEKMGRGEEHEL